MQKLIEVLKEFEKLKSVKTYEWELRDSPIVIPPELKTSFEKNVYLKHNLLEALLIDDNLQHHYWIVNNWGNIGSFKKSEPNDSLIRNLFAQLEKGCLRRSETNVIASLSKIASFYYPSKYAIYDSRAIYSLNWLIFKYCDDKYLFPQPPGRGKSVKLDMETIYALSEIKYQISNHKIAYFEYCKLMNNLSFAVYSEQDKPYLAEMLLFQLAEKIIKEDIIKTVKIQFMN